MSAEQLLERSITDHKGCDVVRQQSVDEIGIELDAFGVDGVIPSPQRNNSGPRKGEPITFDSVSPKQRNIVSPEFVRVCGIVPVASVESFTRKS
jgi:hypothetical protein